MSRNTVAIRESSEEMICKIRRARDAIAGQKSRYVKCPYCCHNAILVFEDATGHIQAKCKNCGKETVYDVLSMRRTKRRYSIK